MYNGKNSYWELQSLKHHLNTSSSDNFGKQHCYTGKVLASFLSRYRFPIKPRASAPERYFDFEGWKKKEPLPNLSRIYIQSSQLRSPWLYQLQDTPPPVLQDSRSHSILINAYPLQPINNPNRAFRQHSLNSISTSINFQLSYLKTRRGLDRYRESLVDHYNFRVFQVLLSD